MATEEALVNFRKSYPIDFTLLDQDEQAVMYISEDKDDWDLYLTIANTSSQTITLIDGSGETSSTNHHFALRFRAGTLAKRAIDLLTSDAAKSVTKTADWDLAKLSPPAPNAPVTLYLRYTGANKVLQKNESHSIRLSGISAAPGTGSRGTQVELIPHQLKFDGEAGTAITNSRLQYLHVTNHSGRKNIPLHVGFVGGNRVLNGADGSVKLRITNVSKSKDVRQSTITFRGPNSPANDPQSQLVLSYDKGHDEWELGTLNPVKPGPEGNHPQATVNVVNKDKSLNLTGRSVSEGDRPEWLMAFDKDFELKYGESFDVEISGIAVSPKAGQANLYLHYNNVPGYWDGQFVCAVEKGPMIVNGDNVGIGTTDPVGRLNIVGSDPARGVQIDNGEIKFRGDLKSHFSIVNGRLPNHLTIDNSSNDKQMNSGFGPPGEPARKSLLSISNDGRVGVGIDEPTTKLDVAGETKTTTLKVDEVSTLHTLKLTADASAPMQTSGGGTIQLGNGSLELGWTADASKKATGAWIQTQGVPLAINPLGNKIVMGASTNKGTVEVHGDLVVTGRITKGIGEWKEVVKYGARKGAEFYPFTSVASMKDAQGVVHLRGVLFMRDDIRKDDYVCRIDPDHYPVGNHDFHGVLGLTTSSDPVWGKLWIVGVSGSTSVDEVGWIKYDSFDYSGKTKMISLDGLKFQSSI